MHAIEISLLVKDRQNQFTPGGNSAVEPPDSIPNSEVKRSCDDGSVAFAMRE